MLSSSQPTSKKCQFPRSSLFQHCNNNKTLQQKYYKLVFRWYFKFRCNSLYLLSFSYITPKISKFILKKLQGFKCQFHKIEYNLLEQRLKSVYFPPPPLLLYQPTWGYSKGYFLLLCLISPYKDNIIQLPRSSFGNPCQVNLSQIKWFLC